MRFRFPENPIRSPQMETPPKGPTSDDLSVPLENAAQHTPPGSVAVPDYELLRPIGSGNYGDVWLARNILGQYRAIKFVYRSRFTTSRPFEREFEGIQRFEPISRSHPSHLAILHVGKNEAEGCFYYVMELADSTKPVPGNPSDHQAGSGAAPNLQTTRPSTLGACLDNGKQESDELIAEYSPRTLRADLEHLGRLPFNQCLRIALGLADALEHLHSHELIHRDIKPSNIVFVNGVPKLADIGLVTEQGEGKSWVGTEGFMPPEGPGTAQGDLFSLGKVFYEMSTGKDRQRFPEPLTQLIHLPDHEDWLEFNAIVEKACANDLKIRYAKASELRADLAMLLGGKSVRRLRRLERQRRRLAIASVVGLALAGVGLVSYQHISERNLRRQLQLLREVNTLRAAVPQVGWRTNIWSKLEGAAAHRIDEQLKLETGSSLSGLDATAFLNEAGHPASGVAFETRGDRAIWGGLHEQASIWDRREKMIRRTGPRLTAGPVGWLSEVTPVQLSPSAKRSIDLATLGRGPRQGAQSISSPIDQCAGPHIWRSACCAYCRWCARCNLRALFQWRWRRGSVGYQRVRPHPNGIFRTPRRVQ